MRKIWIGMLLVCFGLVVSSITLWGVSFDAQLDKANNLMFKTKRTNAQLKQALDIYESLYKQLGQNKAPATLLLEYAFALYYKASYTYPMEGEKGYEEAIKERLVLYSKSNDFLDFLLKNEDKLENENQKAELYFVAGMVKGEIASINSSPFMIVRGRKLLEKALRVNKNFRGGAVYLGLGRMYTKTPRILFGSKDKALAFIGHAQKDFDPPSIISFYFEMDAVLDSRDFKDISPADKERVLKAALLALQWEDKRRKILPSANNAITPEEWDSIKMVHRQLKAWQIPDTAKGLETYLVKMKD